MRKKEPRRSTCPTLLWVFFIQKKKKKKEKKRTKSRDSVALGMAYDERVVKSGSELLGRQFQPIFGSYEVDRFSLDALLVCNLTYAWVSELGP